MSKKSFCFLFFMLPFFAFPQFLKESKITGSAENISSYYFNDHVLNFIQPENAFATNNYLKLNYRYKNFEAGIQYENYLPPLLGFPIKLKGHRLSHRYLAYLDFNMQIKAGNFYEQFGSGLSFRTYEDRALGINTALDGINFSFNPVNFLSVKAIAGKQLAYKKNGNALILGGNVDLSVSELFSETSTTTVNTTFSWLRKTEKPPVEENNFYSGNNVSVFSGGLNISSGQFGLSAELVSKSPDPTPINGAENKKGFALLFNPSYSAPGFGFNILIRRLERMSFYSEARVTESVQMLNYIPANTKQHKYSLANLHPYAALPKNEFGWQADLFYYFSKKTAIGGKYGTKISVNYSQQYAPVFSSGSLFANLVSSENMIYRDINAELDKKWNRRLKTIFNLICLNFENYFVVPGTEAKKPGIVVADIQYQLKPTKTIRIELQHLSAESKEKNWYAIQAEYSVAPAWAVFASNMVNYSGNNIHYPNAGIRATFKSTSIQVNYGRNREGFKCSGGICRWMPAYTGLGFSVSTSF